MMHVGNGRNFLSIHGTQNGGAVLRMTLDDFIFLRRQLSPLAQNAAGHIALAHIMKQGGHNEIFQLDIVHFICQCFVQMHRIPHHRTAVPPGVMVIFIHPPEQCLQFLLPVLLFVKCRAGGNVQKQGVFQTAHQHIFMQILGTEGIPGTHPAGFSVAEHNFHFPGMNKIEFHIRRIAGRIQPGSGTLGDPLGHHLQVALFGKQRKELRLARIARVVFPLVQIQTVHVLFLFL